MSDHKRDDESDTFTHYRDDEGIPRWLHWTFVAINRVGFPIVAFFFMFYISFVSMKNMTVAIGKQSLDLETLILTINTYHGENLLWKKQLLDDIREMRERLK